MLNDILMSFQISHIARLTILSLQYQPIAMAYFSEEYLSQKSYFSYYKIVFTNLKVSVKAVSSLNHNKCYGFKLNATYIILSKLQ